MKDKQKLEIIQKLVGKEVKQKENWFKKLNKSGIVDDRIETKKKLTESESSIDDNILKIAELFHKIVITIKDIIKLEESTKEGIFYLTKVQSYCDELLKMIKTVQNQIDDGKRPNQWSLDEIIHGLNIGETLLVQNWMIKIFTHKGYDEQDKHDIHRICQAYNYLINKFRSLIDQFKPKYKLQNAKINIYDYYKSTDEEIDQFVQGLK